jgi:probable rRNA maturation factor
MRRLGKSRGRKAPAEPSALDLSFHAAIGRQYVRFIRRHLTAAHQQLDSALTELSVALVGDARMSSLHKQFMNIAGPTDVLTFPLDLDHKNRVTSGEIVICVPEAIRQSKKIGTRVDHELLLYALHGMLHLCGYDDTTDAAFRQMHRMEDKILTQLGLGPIFARPASGNARKTNRPGRYERSGV